MKYVLNACLAVVVLTGSAWTQAQELSWHTDYPTALREAKDTGKPLLMAFRCVP